MQGCSDKPQSYANPPSLLPSSSVTSRDPRGGEAALGDGWRHLGKPMGCKEGGKKFLLPANKRETENRKCLPTERPAGVLSAALGSALPWLVWWQMQLKQGHKTWFQSKSRPSGASPCRDAGVGRRDFMKSFSRKLFSRGVCWDHPSSTNKLVCGNQTPASPGSTMGTCLPRSVPYWHPSMVP